MIKPLFSELIGTLLFVAAVLSLSAYAGTPGFVGLYVPAGVAATYAVLSSLFSMNSGGHLNPAVTIGWVALRRMKVSTGVFYILAQLIGALFALLLFRYLSGSAPLANHATDIRAFMAEMLGAIVAVWVAVAVGYRAIVTPFPGLMSGLGLFLGLNLALAFSGGVVNPAVAVAQGSYGLPYLLAPLIGGVIGALLGRLFSPAPTPQ